MKPVVSTLAWWDIADPASSELDELAHRFNLHELQIEDCRHRPQRPKAEEHQGYEFVILKHVQNEGELEFDDVDLFLVRDFLITVRDRDSTVIQQVRARAEQEQQQIE